MSPRGRPPSFDRAEVLDAITRAFWANGYEATSMAEITKITGVNPPSLYAAFGDKASLFGEVVRHYTERYSVITAESLKEEPTSFSAVSRLLRTLATEYVSHEHPKGCMVIAGSPDRDGIDAILRQGRLSNRDLLIQKIQADVDSGELPSTVDPEQLALFVGAVVQGMSQHARDGATEEQLHKIAGQALLAWPS
ncbi:TetR/AcrR family transcriptional regulator [Pseudonocardiaceae bacterium YIM PH 21723]|nr:TetR/AcrR family transcriptional regulator [Pseudonocardiaceae bacterium YIM PH 21723]